MKPLLFQSLIAMAVFAICYLSGLHVLHAQTAIPNRQPQAINPEHTTHFTREEVDHNFGTVAGKTYYPARAIDTNSAPNIAFDTTTRSDTPLKYYELSPNTYFFYGNIAEVDENNRGFNGNAGFVVTEDSVVVIDALGSPLLGKRMLHTIKTVTDKPIKYLIITHNHPDHAYGAIAFKAVGTTIIGHEGTLKYIESDRIEHSVNYRNTFIKKDMEGFKAVQPDILIGGEIYSKQTLTTGGKTFEIYNTGDHHSYGDLIVYQRDENIVWISDLAFNNRVTFMADGHSEKAIAAQTWLLHTFKDAKLMIPGHGSAQTPPFQMVLNTRDYMQRLRKDVAVGIKSDIDLQTMIDNTHYHDWEKVQLYPLNHKKNVDFVYRELEMELF